MTSRRQYVRQGKGTVRPYLYGNADLPDLLAHAFGAVELERHVMGPGSFHIEAEIGDSVVVLEIGDTHPPGATVASVYVYVDDVDGAYARALAHGATSLAEPRHEPYQERAAGVRDSFGNVWWLSTYLPPNV